VLKAGDQSMAGPLHVAGLIESTSGGVKFPDATTQATAGVAAANVVQKTGDQSMAGPLHVAGLIESTSGGVKFPDATTQATAGVAAANAVQKTGDQSMAGPLHVAGLIESSVDGLKYPDGTIQASAAAVIALNNWTTVLDLDLSSEANQTLTTDGNYTIGGKTWTKINSVNDRVAMALVNGQGLVIKPGATSDLYGANRTLPAIVIPLSSLIANMGPMTQIRVWLYVSATNRAQNYDFACLAIEKASPISNYAIFQIYNAAAKVQLGTTLNGTGKGQAIVGGGSYATDNVVTMEVTTGIAGQNSIGCSGAYAAGWPAVKDLRIIGGQNNTGDTYAMSYLGTPADWNLLLGGGRAGSGNTAFSTTIARARVEVR
jgi:hypothetical protein